jgi:hypothetical protein
LTGISHWTIIAQRFLAAAAEDAGYVRSPRGSEKEIAVGIIRKAAPKPGWRSTVEIPRRVLTCETCGALCDEATTNEHDAWHLAIDQRSLPALLDILLAPPVVEPEPEVLDDEVEASEPDAIKRHIYLPRLMAADELRRQDRFGRDDDDFADDLELADGLGA